MPCKEFTLDNHVTATHSTLGIIISCYKQEEGLVPSHI